EKILTLLQGLCSNAVARPTPISARLLQRGAELARVLEGGKAPPTAREATGPGLGPFSGIVAHWQQVWEEHELSRRLFAAARSQVYPGRSARGPWVHSNSVPASLSGAARAAGWSTPRLFWFSAPETRPSSNSAVRVEPDWLAVRLDSEKAEP